MASTGDDGWETSTELPAVPGSSGAEDGDRADGERIADDEGSDPAEDGSDSAAAVGSDARMAAAGGDANETAGEGEAGDGQPGEDEAGDELRRALEQLDGEILSERIAAGERAKDPRQGNAGDSRTGGTEAAGAPAGSGNGDGQEPNAGAPARRTVAASVPPVPQPPLPLPADTPDARDDDVVARQLREAAMAETDPELREKLWQEYERYKASL